MTQLAFTQLRPAEGGLRFQQFESQGRRFAASKARSWNAESRTFEAILATETPCRTYRLTTEWALVEVEEVLPMRALKDLKGIRGRPLLDTHQSWDVGSIVGVIEDAWIEGTNLAIRARLSERDDVRGIAQDIAGGIINSLSVGFDILKDGRPVERAGKPPLIEVASWSVREGSLVADPADKNARIRSAAPTLLPATSETNMDSAAFRSAFIASFTTRAATDAETIADEVIAMISGGADAAAAGAAAGAVAAAPAAPGARSAADVASIALIRGAVAARSAANLPTFDVLEKTGASIETLQGVLTASLATPAAVSTTAPQQAGARSIKDIRFSDTTAGKQAAGK